MPHHRLIARTPPSLSARLGVFLGLLAVLVALLAPLSLLVEEVRTGRLGAICSASATLAGHGDDGTGQPSSGSHCNWCGSAALALPPLPVSSIPCFAGLDVADLALPADAPAAITGLPFSRGPPRL